MFSADCLPRQIRSSKKHCGGGGGAVKSPGVWCITGLGVDGGDETSSMRIVVSNEGRKLEGDGWEFVLASCVGVDCPYQIKIFSLAISWHIDGVDANTFVPIFSLVVVAGPKFVTYVTT